MDALKGTGAIPDTAQITASNRVLVSEVMGQAEGSQFLLLPSLSLQADTDNHVSLYELKS